MIIEQSYLEGSSVVLEVMGELKDVHTAISQGKTLRACALVGLIAVMCVVALWVYPPLIVFITKWLVVHFGIPLCLSKGAATIFVNIINKITRYISKVAILKSVS